MPPNTELQERVTAHLRFVEIMAGRMAAAMPHSIDVNDLRQDGVIGLIDAAERFDSTRGIGFETFAERRVRGAMVDALRKDAWPRGIRKARRNIEQTRAKLALELGHEPDDEQLAQRLGTTTKRLWKQMVRISHVEATSPFSSADVSPAALPQALIPFEPDRPDRAYERTEARLHIRKVLPKLPERERRVMELYYFEEVTMKDIGRELGVNESRISQLHARAIRRLREFLSQSGIVRT